MVSSEKSGGELALEPRREERRGAILQVAREAFLEDGFAGTSMSTIAARLGGSKGTLYAYFASKEELFEAVVEDMAERYGGVIRGVVATGEVPEKVLTAYGTRLLEVVASGEPLKLQRLVTAEAERFPELGRLLHEHGPNQCAITLAAFFERSIAAGRLRPHDATLSALQFMGLCRARTHEPTMWNLRAPPTKQEIRAHVAEAVTTFMAAYGPADQG